MRVFAAGLMLTLLAGCSPFVYHSPEATAELRGAIDAANGARIDGPARVRLAGKTDLFVQTGLVYIPPAPAGRLLRALGERPTRELLGLLVCVTPERTDVAALYALEAGSRELPDIVVAGWRRAPELDSLRASAATAPGSAACGT